MNIRHFFLLFIVSCSSSTWAQDHPTWCVRSERELFSCTFSNGKVASLCATSDWSRSTGGLQYRFGRLRNRQAEMIYPQVVGSSARFAALSSDTFADKEKERSVWVSFRVTKFRYVIQDYERDGTHQQVIKVEQDAKPTRTLLCEKNSVLLSHQAEKILHLLDEDEYDER